MAVTNIPNVQNWTVTPQNGQSGYFDLMNTWLGQSTLVIASLQSAITAQNAANSEINTLASQAENNAIIATGLANYQGEYSTLTTYSKSQSVSVGGLYYTSKVDGNLDKAVTDSAYWVANPINNKYDRGNILGTVSQTAGVPTGAIIESGNNVNGRYTKFADGTMICNGTYSGGMTMILYITGLYMSSITVTFPAAFAYTTYTLSASGPNNVEQGIGGIGSTNTTTSSNIFYLSKTSTVTSSSLRYSVIGRWF